MFDSKYSNSDAPLRESARSDEDYIDLDDLELVEVTDEEILAALDFVFPDEAETEADKPATPDVAAAQAKLDTATERVRLLRLELRAALDAEQAARRERDGAEGKSQ